MERLPKEILSSIAKKLSRRDQLKCALVSRFWCDLMRTNGFIFNDIILRKVDLKHTASHEILAFFEKNNYGLTTRHLTISGKSLTFDALLRIADVFRNIEWLTLNVRTYEANPHQLQHIMRIWRYIKRINGTAPPNINRDILTVCSPFRLEFLELSYNEDYFAGYFAGEDFSVQLSSEEILEDVSKLECAPELKSLKLHGAYIFYESLVAIHEAVPNLKSLCLRDPLNSLNNSFYLTGHVPANTMKVESLDCLIISDELEIMRLDENCRVDIPALMKFISNVYTDLTSFEFLILSEGSQLNINIVQLRSYLCQALSNWRKLKTYSFSPYPIDGTILQVMQNNGIKLQELTVHTNRSYSSLNNLFSDIPVYADVVKDLKTLHFQQASDRLCARIDHNFLLVGNILHNLETLKFSTYYDGLGIDYEAIGFILDALPHLKHLKVVIAVDQSERLFAETQRAFTNQPTQLATLQIDWAFPEVVFDNDKDWLMKSFAFLDKAIDGILCQCPLLEEFKSTIRGVFVLDAAKLFKKDDIQIRFDFERSLNIQKIDITSFAGSYFIVMTQGEVIVQGDEEERIIEEDGKAYITVIVPNKDTKVITFVDQ